MEAKAETEAVAEAEAEAESTRNGKQYGPKSQRKTVWSQIAQQKSKAMVMGTVRDRVRRLATGVRSMRSFPVGFSAILRPVVRTVDTEDSTPPSWLPLQLRLARKQRERSPLKLIPGGLSAPSRGLARLGIFAC